MTNEELKKTIIDATRKTIKESKPYGRCPSEEAEKYVRILIDNAS